MVFLKCGCKSFAIDLNGKPICLIHNCNEALVIDEKVFENRMAECSSCGKKCKSDINLPFFKYNKDKEFDEYYCGCGGWN